MSSGLKLKLDRLASQPRKNLKDGLKFENLLLSLTLLLPIRQIEMISNSSADISNSESFADQPSKLELWLDRISDDWAKSVKKVRKSEPLTKVSKKTFKQICFGLDSALVERVAPLMAHVSGGDESGHDFEQLATLAESIASSVQAFWQQDLESTTAEVSGSPTTSELPLVAALSSLLVANRLRRVILNGEDQQFERIVRSLRSLEKTFAADDPHSVLLYQWLAIELPLTMAAQLYSIKPFKKEGKLAAKRFVDVTRELLDSDGWPGSCCFEHFGPLAASWTRCVKLAKACKFKLGSSFHSQIDWVPEQFVRLHGPKRKLIFNANSDAKSNEVFVEFILGLESEGDARELAERSGLLKAGKKKLPESPSADPTCISEWSSSALLKSSWAPKSPVVAIDFATPHSLIEVAAKETLISGSMPLEVRDDGQVVDWGQEGFEVVCDLEDSETIYLELEISRGSLQLYRQFLLSKKDRFLFFADSVVKRSAGEIDYRLKLPLAKGIDVVRENGTRELYLNRKGKGIQSLVLPLALPEWSSERCRGLMTTSRDETLGADVLNIERALQLPTEGGALYCPMFFDLDPKRSRKKRTWRSLTVAETLSIVRPEVAVAYRVQVDEEQWVFYRALQSIGNRTFMGQNFAGDFYAGKFDCNGAMTELVEVG